MTDIRLAGNLISIPSFVGFDFGHLQLVYGGIELEVQATKLLTLGHWDVEPHNSPFEVPNGDFSPAHYAETTITFTHGESPDDVWELLLQVRDDIADIANTLPYDLFFNSNSYANTLLAAVGVATQNFIPYPAAVDWYPGVTEDVAQGLWGLEYTITGTLGNDVLHGGRLDDAFKGGEGVDFLDGGNGSDMLYANDTGPESDAVADYLTGGGGRDAFYVGNALGSSRVARYNSTIHDYAFDESVRGTFDVIRDFSKLDKIFISLNGAEYLGLSNTDFSSFSLEPAGYSFSGKDVYVAIGDGFSLNAVYDTYEDPNLGETITVLIFFEQELKTPIFGIQMGSGVSLASMVIGGSSGDDTLFGTSDNDSISSGSGDDEIYGDEGDDVVSGGAGDDTFYSGHADGSDSYDGEAGTDALTVETTAHNVVDLVAGTITALGEATDSFSDVEVFFTGSGDDHFVDSDGGRLYSGGEGTDSVAFALDASSYRVTASSDGYLVERVYVDRDAPLEERYLRLESIEDVTFAGLQAEFSDVVTVEINGTSSTDTLTGSARNDMILGGDGNDVLSGGEGSDILDGGDGDSDQVNYEGLASNYLFKRNADGSVTVTSATYGTDTLFNIELVHFSGESSASVLADLAPVVGSNVISGTAGDDDLDGSDQANILIGNNGNDDLSGNGGNDLLVGGNGDDRFNGGAGDDIIDGGEGSFDEVDYTGILQDYTFTRNADNSVTVFSEQAGDDTLVNIENIRLYTDDHSSYETYSLSDLAPPQQTPTNDIFIADGSPQTFNGGAGTDTVDYGLSAEGIWADLTTQDDVYGDTLTSIENLTGSAFDDYLGGNANANTLRGNNGADGLDGGAGNDTLIGGNGDDWFNGGAGNDIIDGGDGEYDEVDYFGSLDEYSFTRNADHSVTVTNVNGGTDTLINVEDIWLYSEDYSSPYEVYSLAELAPEPPVSGESDIIADSVNNGGLYDADADIGLIEGPGVKEAYSAAVESADIIAFPTNATASARLDDLGADYQTTAIQEPDADAELPSAEIISLEDFVAHLQDDAVGSDLWFEPEPIGSVI